MQSRLIEIIWTPGFYNEKQMTSHWKTNQDAVQFNSIVWLMLKVLTVDPPVIVGYLWEGGKKRNKQKQNKNLGPVLK